VIFWRGQRMNASEIKRLLQRQIQKNPDVLADIPDHYGVMAHRRKNEIIYVEPFFIQVRMKKQGYLYICDVIDLK
jgi:hypothetical protein